MSATEAIVLAAVLIFWIVLALIVARIIGAFRIDAERDEDDAEQLRIVSKPAPLTQNPRIRAGGGK